MIRGSRRSPRLPNDLKQAYTIELIHARCKPRSSTYALSRLRAAGYKLAVASNSVRRSVELMMGKERVAAVSHKRWSQPRTSPAENPIRRYITRRSGCSAPAAVETLIVEDNAMAWQPRARPAHMSCRAGSERRDVDRIVAHIARAETEASS